MWPFIKPQLIELGIIWLIEITGAALFPAGSGANAVSSRRSVSADAFQVSRAQASRA